MGKPNFRFMAPHASHWIALGFGSGLSAKAPGTAGTLWAWLVYALLVQRLSDGQIFWLLIASFALGWWACKRTAERMGTADPGSIVWDEVVAFWLVLWIAAPQGFWAQLLAFGLFRFFDAAKPGPVAWADSLYKGFGWRGSFGIMWDDLMAAFCTLLVWAAGVRLLA